MSELEDEDRQYGFTKSPHFVLSPVSTQQHQHETENDFQARPLDADGLPTQPEDPWVFQPRVAAIPSSSDAVAFAIRRAEARREAVAETKSESTADLDHAAPAEDPKRLRSNARHPHGSGEQLTPSGTPVDLQSQVWPSRDAGAVEAPHFAPSHANFDESTPGAPAVVDASQADAPYVKMVPVLRNRQSIRERHQAYVLLRVLTGLNFFGHGYARIFTGTFLQGFAKHMQQQMAHAPLDPGLVLAAGYAIPCVELAAGTMLLLGVGVRWALYLALLLMMVLMFGVTMAQNWTTAGEQLIYGLVLACLLFAREPYDMSWAGLIRRRH